MSLPLRIDDQKEEPANHVNRRERSFTTEAPAAAKAMARQAENTEPGAELFNHGWTRINTDEPSAAEPQPQGPDGWMNGLMPKSTFNPSGVEFSMQFCNPGLHPGLFKFNPFGILPKVREVA